MFVLEGLNRTDPPKLLKERIMLEGRVLMFPRNHFLFEVFDRKLQQYLEADLIASTIRHLEEFFNPKKYSRNMMEPFAVLTLSELEAGFVVCLLPLAFTVFVFGIEWMPTLKDLVVFLIIFQKYFEVKKLEQANYSKRMSIIIRRSNLQKHKVLKRFGSGKFPVENIVCPSSIVSNAQIASMLLGSPCLLLPCSGRRNVSTDPRCFYLQKMSALVCLLLLNIFVKRLNAANSVKI